MLGLGQRSDRVVEHIGGGVLGPFVQDPRQIATRDLHIAAGEGGRQLDEVAAVGVDEMQRAVAGLVLADLLQDPHLLQHRQMHLAAEVHRLPARTQIRRPLHDRDLEPVPGQPVGQGRPGDARPRDQNLLVHCPLLRVLSMKRSLGGSADRPRTIG